MKNKLKFIISLVLVLTLITSVVITPASSFEHNQITSSYAMLLINLDTDTTVYSQKPDQYWIAGEMSELMTFILMTEKVKDPSEVDVKVTKAFIDGLDVSDDCLKQFVDETLTLKDLAAIMMLTSGSDAANLIADTVSNGDIPAFVSEMNARAKELGCKLTSFLSPGSNSTRRHYTTCEDIAVMYRHLMGNTLYQEIMESPTYTPDRYDKEDKAHTVTTNNSIINNASPYYFRYVEGGKYSFSKVAGASLVVSTLYKDKSYLFVALRGKNKAEENVFADARRMTTWGYLNLSDHKVISTDTSVYTSTVQTAWGSYHIPLYANDTATKTLPNDYDVSKLTVKISVPDQLKLPLFKGESVGTAQILYGKELLDNADIVPNHDEGVSLLNDLGRFGGYALAKMFPNTSASASNEPDIQAVTEPSTEPATVAKQKTTAPTAPKPTRSAVDMEE